MILTEEIAQNFFNVRAGLYNKIVNAICKYISNDNFVFIPLSPIRDDGIVVADTFSEILTHDMLIKSLTKKLVILLDDSFDLDVLVKLHTYISNHVVDTRNVIVIHNSYNIALAWQNYCQVYHIESFSVCELLTDSGILSSLVEPLRLATPEVKTNFTYLASTQLGSISNEKIILKQLILELLPNNLVHVDILNSNGRYTKQEVEFWVDRLLFFQDAKLAELIINKIEYPIEVTLESHMEKYVQEKYLRASTQFVNESQIASKSLISLCRETNHYGCSYPKVTEKTIKSILHMQPILYFCCPPGNHAALNTLGIENTYTFFNYNFDDDKYIWTRNLSCLENLKQFVNLKNNDYVEIYNSIYSQLKYNFDLVISGKLLENILSEFEKSFCLALDKQKLTIDRTNKIFEKSFND